MVLPPRAISRNFGWSWSLRNKLAVSAMLRRGCTSLVIKYESVREPLSASSLSCASACK
jgi:hypothetical protein